MDLLEELKNLAQKLDQKGIDYALCGGLDDCRLCETACDT